MNCYAIRYIVKNTKIKTICSYAVTAQKFDSAYKQFKKDIKDGEIISAKIVNFKNFRR